MNFTLKKNERLSGTTASIYEVFLNDETDSVFDQFLGAYMGSHRTQIINIVDRLESIGHIYGAREQFFKDKEGKYGDLVEALYDTPEKGLRLYCMRFGNDCIILGGGGPKAPGVRAWQDDENLTYHAELMIEVAKKVHHGFEEKDWKWAANYRDMNGDLDFKEDNNE